MCVCVCVCVCGFPELWFVVRWMEDDTDDILYDVLSAKNVAVKDQHVHEIEVKEKEGILEAFIPSRLLQKVIENRQETEF